MAELLARCQNLRTLKITGMIYLMDLVRSKMAKQVAAGMATFYNIQQLDLSEFSLDKDASEEDQKLL